VKKGGETHKTRIGVGAVPGPGAGGPCATNDASNSSGVSTMRVACAEKSAVYCSTMGQSWLVLRAPHFEHL